MRDLLKRALDALNEIEYEDNNGEKYAWELIKSLEAELAKPDEPVAKVVSDQFYVGKRNSTGNILVNLVDLDTIPSGTQLYTLPPRQQEPLSDEEIREIIRSEYHGSTHCPVTIDFVRVIELAHGIGGGK